jgi:hypothetical protein
MSLQRGPRFDSASSAEGGHEIHLGWLARQSCKLLSDPEGRHHTSFSKKIVASGFGTMLRKACGSFALMVAGELTGDPEVEEHHSLEEVFGWFGDCPEQIERAVIVGGRLAPIAMQTGARRPKGIATLRLLVGTAQRP